MLLTTLLFYFAGNLSRAIFSEKMNSEQVSTFSTIYLTSSSLALISFDEEEIMSGVIRFMRQKGTRSLQYNALRLRPSFLAKVKKTVEANGYVYNFIHKVSFPKNRDVVYVWKAFIVSKEPLGDNAFYEYELSRREYEEYKAVIDWPTSGDE